MMHALKFQFKVAVKSWINLMLVVAMFLIVLWLSGLGGGLGISEITNVGVYVSSPMLRLVVKAIPGVLVFDSPGALEEAVKSHRVLLGVDMDHKVIYAWGILPREQKDALVWLASGMWRVFTGKGVKYVDEVWWDPFAGDLGYTIKGLILMLMLPLDAAFIYISLLSRARLRNLFPLWETLGVDRFRMHLAMVVVALLMSAFSLFPLIIREPSLLRLMPWVAVLTFITLGISVGFVRFAHSDLMALLSVIPPMALAILGMTYAILPGPLPFATWVPWTYASIDLLKFAGAEGSVPMPVSGWVVAAIWVVIALLVWVWGGASDEGAA